MHSSQFCLSASLSFPLSFRALHLSLSLSLCVGSCFSISSLRFKVNGFSRKKIHTHRHTHQSEIFPMKKNRGQRPHTPEGTRCEKNGRECVPKTHTHTHTPKQRRLTKKKRWWRIWFSSFKAFVSIPFLCWPPPLSLHKHTHKVKNLLFFTSGRRFCLMDTPLRDSGRFKLAKIAAGECKEIDEQRTARGLINSSKFVIFFLDLWTSVQLDQLQPISFLHNATLPDLRPWNKTIAKKVKMCWIGPFLSLNDQN